LTSLLSLAEPVFSASARLIAYLCLLLFTPFVIAQNSTVSKATSISVAHWWLSESELKSATVLQKHLLQHDLDWKKISADDNSSSGYLGNIQAWLTKSQRPDAAIVIGSAAFTHSNSKHFLQLDQIAQEQNWEDVIPYAIQATSKHKGHWISAPFNNHSTNWLWLNKRLFSQLDLPEPETWNDLIAVLKRAKQLGIPALVTLNSDWQQTQLFEMLLVATAGMESYRRIFIGNKIIEAEDKRQLLTTFLRLKEISHYFSDNTLNSTWNEASDLLGQGKVLMQINGSWVNSELKNLGWKADEDYICLRFPDTQGAYIFNSDHFVFFKNGPAAEKNQLQMARVLLDKEFQRDLSMISGAAPVRVDISTKGFDSCTKKNVHDLRMANMRHAVIPMISNPKLFKIVNDYLDLKTTAEQATEQTLALFIQITLDNKTNAEPSYAD